MKMKQQEGNGPVSISFKYTFRTRTLTLPMGTLVLLPCAMVILSVVQAVPTSDPPAPGVVSPKERVGDADGVYWIRHRPDSCRKQILQHLLFY